MSGYIGTKSVLLSTTAASVTGNANIGGDLTVDTNPLFVDSANNRVGIGTSSPAQKLTVEDGVAFDPTVSGGEGGNINIRSGTAAAAAQGALFGGVSLGSSDRVSSAGIAALKAGVNDDNVGLSFFVHGSNTQLDPSVEAMRIDSSGRLLVGLTAAQVTGTAAGFQVGDGAVGATAASAASGYFSRKTTDGDVLVFRKDTTTVGSIATRGGFIRIGKDDVGLEFHSGNNAIYPANISTGAFTDNVTDFGGNTFRFVDIYATNGTIQTSDANEKQQIADLTAAEMQAATAISKLFKTFKWNDSVAEKGDDARIHTGVIAQEVEAAMTAAGLDAGRYAFFISTTWWESTEVIPAVEEVLDEEGNVVTEAQPERTVTHTHDTLEEAPEGAVERNRKGIRYPQLLSFIGAATEQRLASIEARLDALEGN